MEFLIVDIGATLAALASYPPHQKPGCSKRRVT
jgi:hypothetical protein